MAQQPARDDLRPLEIGVRQEDRELVAPDAECAIGLPERTVHELAEAAQEAVAAGVPTTVVDGLELVEVDDQERERVLVARCRRHLAIELLLEGPMVAEPGEGVEEGIGQCGFVAHLEVGLGRDQRRDVRRRATVATAMAPPEATTIAVTSSTAERALAIS